MRIELIDEKDNRTVIEGTVQFDSVTGHMTVMETTPREHAYFGDFRNVGLADITSIVDSLTVKLYATQPAISGTGDLPKLFRILIS